MSLQHPHCACDPRRRASSPFLPVVSIAVLGAVTSAGAWAQGCVAAKGAGQMPRHSQAGEQADSPARLSSSVAYRWLNSDRHFVGSEEQKQRKREGSQVINRSHFVDFSLTYDFNDRYSATLTIPYADHDRSSVVRDSQRRILQRFHTQNSGLADIRLMGNMWLLDPKTHADGNVLLGLGLDLPTGKKDARDTFQAFDAATGTIVPRVRTVDQSIQLGDGGYGVLLDVYAYKRIRERLSVFATASYAITPENTNGVPTFRGNPFESVMSIADSYMGRVGFDYLVWPRYGLSFTLDGRIEGVAVRDLVGNSDGFRRPGYALAVEPGVSAMVGTYSMSLFVPLTVYRNRQRSVADERETAATGQFRHGDAAFADSLVMFNVTRSFQ